MTHGHYLIHYSKTLLWACAMLCCLLVSSRVQAQKTAAFSQPDKLFKEAQQYFSEGKYAVAMQLFKRTINEINYFQETNRQLVYQDANYYYVVCALKLQQPNAEELAKDYLSHFNNHPRQQLANYHLANYYFHQNKLREAIPYYEKAGIDNLSNDEIADARFELGYCYFNVKNFNKARLLFGTIKEIKNKYYIAANYYYGFIAYHNKDYDDALRSFQRVADEPKYNQVVPYYISEIYYFQNKRDQLISYAEPLISKGNIYYDLELKQLVGQAYFEKKDYAKALPYLEAYNNEAEQLRKEDVYQLSYCYYETGNYRSAINGFKQLSNATDSLGQNSMYLLGDCYLKTGQKANARNAFAFCARNSYNPLQQQISRFTYGKLSYELGYQDVAINELQGFISAYPNSGYVTEAKEILTSTFVNTNNYKDALSVIESIPNRSPAISKAYQKVTYGRAMQLLNDGNLEEAERLLDASLQNPSDPGLQQLAYFWKGEISLRKGNYDKALSSLYQYIGSGNAGSLAAAGEANEQTAYYNLGYCLLKKENYAAALPYFQSAQQAMGVNGEKIANDALRRSADCYYMLKDYPKALSLYDHLIASNAQGADYAMYQKSIILGITGKYNEKLALLKQLNTQYPGSNFNNEADFEIANTYLVEGKYREAIPYLKNVVEKQANTAKGPKALLRLGIAYFNLNDNNQAIDYLKQVVQQYPNSTEADEALQSLKNIYVNKGNTEEFLAFLQSTGKKITTSAADSLTYAAAEAQFSNGNYNAAITAFDNYLQQYPNGQFTLSAYFYKAESLYNKKDFINALPNYEKVLSQGNNRFTERSTAQAARLCLYAAKDYGRAKTYYQQLKEIATSKENILEALRGLLHSSYQLQAWEDVKTNATALLAASSIGTDDQIISHFYLGKALQAQNDCANAISEFKSMVTLTKSQLGAEARYDIAACYFLQNELDKAETAAFDVIKTTPSYDYWIAKSYILLGDIYTRQKDYFNAKATLQSIVDNCKIKELVEIAQGKLSTVIQQERTGSKIAPEKTKKQ